MNKLKNDSYSNFWDWLDSISIKYKNYEIKNAILAQKYSQLLQITWDRKGFNLRKLLSSVKWNLILHLFTNKISKRNKNLLIKKNYDSLYDLSIKNLYAINFSPNDPRTFLHICPLVESDDSSLVITVRNDVYKYFNKIGKPVILLDISNPWRRKNDLEIGIPLNSLGKKSLLSLDLFSLVLLSKAASLIDLLDILTNKNGLPQTLITLQDFHAFDSIFATYFLGKIPTVTLQHGRAGIPKDIKKNLWKYIISDWMIVFSTNQAKALESMGVSPKKIIILGSAKYDLYIDRMEDRLKNNKNKRVLLSIQETILSKKYIETTYNFVKYLLNSKEHFVLSIRFHPEVEKSKRKNFMQKLRRENIFSHVILEISKNKDLLEDISKSTIVLVSDTTLAIEAMLFKKPIIEYLSSKREGATKFYDYRDFALHASTSKEAKTLIIKLLNDHSFY